jgi:hypothetical protein
MPQSEFTVNLSCKEEETGSLIINYAAGSDLAAFVPEPLAIAAADTASGLRRHGPGKSVRSDLSRFCGLTLVWPCKNVAGQ